MSEQLLAPVVPPSPRRGYEHDVDSDLAAALLAAADVDAEALADALHDDALQALVVARYAADAAVRGADVATARDAVQEAVVALRRAVWLLRPRGRDDLPAALAELSTRTPTPLRLDLDGDLAAALPADTRALAYRFVQACAHATTVSLRREGEFAVVTTDAEPTDRAGWTARARALGGHLDLPGGHARLLLALPDSDPKGA